MTARQLRVRFDHSVRRAGATRAKWGVIATVARLPGATQRTIAAALEVTEVTAGRLVDRLCADGYLERRENPDDRRGYSIHLTSAAEPLLQKLGQIARTHEEQVFVDFSEDELVRLDGLLDKLARNLAATASRRGTAKSERS